MRFASLMRVLNHTAASLAQATANYYVPRSRCIHDGLAIAINLKTRLFSICIGAAAAAERWDTRLDVRFYSLVQRAPATATGAGRLTDRTNGRPYTRDAANASGFVSRPVRP